MHANAELITRFYEAFARLDGAAMAACYAPDATFSDPVFPDLRGPRVGGMWRMLTANAREFSLVFDGVEADDSQGRAHWVATYTFSGTGRRVVNDIQARFTFRDGQIATHKDSFDLWKWTRQALGPVGWVAGWTPMVQGKVRSQADRGLTKFLAG
jgi:ketosteroid isomerase-like protein